MQDCSISIANTLEILQSCTKPSIYGSNYNIVKYHMISHSSHVIACFMTMTTSQECDVVSTVSIFVTPDYKVVIIPAPKF